MGSQSYTYSVPLFSLPGRHGLNLNLVLMYNSGIWEGGCPGSVFYAPDETGELTQGFRLDMGQLLWLPNADTANSASVSGVLIDPNGTKHLLVYSGSGSTYNTVDSTFITVNHTPGNDTSAAATVASDVVIYKNGVQALYQGILESPTTRNKYQNLTLPSKIEDATGNYITINYAFPATLESIVDTVGRKINFIYGSNGLECVTDGATCTTSGAHTYSFSYNTSYTMNYDFTNLSNPGGIVGAPPVVSGDTMTVLSGITRPNETSVAFSYGDWGIVNEIQEKTNTGVVRYSTQYNFPLASSGALSSPPAYTTQTVNTIEDPTGDPTPQTLVWNYQAVSKTLIDPSTGSTYAVVSCSAVTDPSGTSQITSYHTGGVGGLTNPLNGIPTQTMIGTGSGTSSSSPCTTPPPTIWQTVDMGWEVSCPPGTTTALGCPDPINPLPQDVTTILSDGKTESSVFYNNYDSFGDPTSTTVYDFGTVGGAAGTVLQTTTVTYSTSSGNIHGLPTSIQVSNSSGTVLSSMTLTYDNYATNSLVGYGTLPSVGFDDTNYPASNTTTPRGNFTGATVYTNAAAATGAINSTFTYDIFGNRLTAQTGTGAPTASSFSMNTDYAYPDSVSFGPTSSQLTTSFTYDMGIGKLATSTDPNGQITSFNDYDVEGRLGNIVTPDGITTTYAYDDGDADGAVSVSTSANGAVSKVISDFLGHTQAQEVLNNSSVVSQMSHLYNPATATTPTSVQASEPYGPGGTPLYTTSIMDPLGRTTSVTPPTLSGTNQVQNPYTTQYAPTTYTDASGNTHYGLAIQGTDPAGKSRIQYRNALGQIARVDEPSTTTPGTSATATVTISGYDLTATGSGSAVPAMSGSPLASDSGGGEQLYYLGTNQHVMSLFFSSSEEWENADLTAKTDNALPSTGTSLSANYNSSDANEWKVYFVGTNQHVYELYCCVANWAIQDLTATTKAPLVSGSGSLTSIANANGAADDVFYIASDGHIHVIYIYKRCLDYSRYD